VDACRALVGAGAVVAGVVTLGGRPAWVPALYAAGLSSFACLGGRHDALDLLLSALAEGRRTVVVAWQASELEAGPSMAVQIAELVKQLLHGERRERFPEGAFAYELQGPLSDALTELAELPKHAHNSFPCEHL